MNTISNESHAASAEQGFLTVSRPSAFTLPETIDHSGRQTLVRMFRDPRVLEPHERGDLIAKLRQAVTIEPNVAETRVLLGMALCVDLQAQEALEELRTATTQAPDCFIAHLKFGELLMRLRICDQAAEQTHRAAQLACNPIQSDLARKQAATIRTMQREGIERGGYKNLLPRLFRFREESSKPTTSPVLLASK